MRRRSASDIVIHLAMVAMVSVVPLSAQEPVRNIIIVAGQSNAMNWHADAGWLSASALDTGIPFYYNIGMPPDRGFDVPFNSTSDSVWTTLSIQTQRPFVRYQTEFFGPEMTLARDLSAHVPQLAVFKCAYGGSDLASDWKKGIATGNRLYDHVMGEYRHATALLTASGIPFQVVGFFWMQGESDASDLGRATAYESNLEELIQNIRSDVGNPALKVVLGRIGAQLPSPYIHKEMVRQAQMRVAERDPFVRWVDIDDQPLDSDSVHLLAQGVGTLGNRMAAAWLDLTGTGIEHAEVSERAEYRVRNVPNPFNPSTEIRFTLTEPELVTVKIFDVLGRELETLTRDKYSAGTHSVSFQAGTYATGVYLYEVRIGAERILRRMSLVK